MDSTLDDSKTLLSEQGINPSLGLDVGDLCVPAMGSLMSPWISRSKPFQTSL